MSVRIRLMGTDGLELDQVEWAIREVLEVPIPGPAETYYSQRMGDPTLRRYLEATGTRNPGTKEGKRS